MKLVGAVLRKERTVLAPNQSLTASAQAPGRASVRSLPLGERRVPAVDRKATRVADVMNRELAAVHLADTVQEAARLMWKSYLTSLPVVDGSGMLIGLVIDTDVMARIRSRHRAWWRTLLEQPDELAREYRRRAGTTVADIMGAVPATLSPEMPIQAAADLLANTIRELPVVVNGRLVGTVSRTDLFQALVTDSPKKEEARPDPELVQEMKARLAEEDWVTNHALGIEARAGVLWLHGLVDNAEEKTALSIMACGIPGCKGVENGVVPRSQFRSHWM